MKRLMRYKWSILVIVLNLMVMGWFWSQLPSDARIPSHWNIHNEIDGWMSRNGSLVFGTVLTLGMFLLMYFLPLYSPKYKVYEERFESILPGLTFVLVLFFALINVYMLYLAWAGITRPTFQLIFVLMGLLFIFLGNLLPKVPKNFFIGVKTPWTLSSDEVWQRTHRLAGYLFVISGLILIVKAFVPGVNTGFHNLSMIVAMGILLYPLLHSFIIYKQIERK